MRSKAHILLATVLAVPLSSMVTHVESKAALRSSRRSALQHTKPRELIDLSTTPTMAPHLKLPPPTSSKADASIESSGGYDDAVDISMFANASNNNDDNFNDDSNNPRSSGYRLFMSLLTSSLCIGGFIVALNGVAHMTGCPCLEVEDEETGGGGHTLKGSVKRRISSFNRMIEPSSSTVGFVETYEVPRMLSDFDNIMTTTDKYHETTIVSNEPTTRKFGSRLLSAARAATSMRNIKLMISLNKKNKKPPKKKEVVDNNFITSNTTIEDVNMNMDVYVRDMDDDERDDVEKNGVIPPSTSYKPPEMMDGSDCERDSIISMDLFSPITRSLGSMISMTGGGPTKQQEMDLSERDDTNISMGIFSPPLRARTRSQGSIYQMKEPSKKHEMPKREMLL